MKQPVSPLPPMTKEEARLARKMGREVEKILREMNKGPVHGGFVDDRCHHQRHQHDWAWGGDGTWDYCTDPNCRATRPANER